MKPRNEAIVALFLAVIGGCQNSSIDSQAEAVSWPPEGGSRGGEGLFYDFPEVGPTNQLQLELAPVSDTFPYADSVLVRYHVENHGPTQTFRDLSEFYYFTVIGPDGRHLVPIFYEESYGGSAGRAMEIAPGGTTALHAINLACMPYHARTFEPLFPWSVPANPAPEGFESSPCQLVYDFSAGGRYIVIAQHIPVQPDGTEGSPEFMPSRADTVEIVVVSGARSERLDIPATPTARERR